MAHHHTFGTSGGTRRVLKKGSISLHPSDSAIRARLKILNGNNRRFLNASIETANGGSLSDNDRRFAIGFDQIYPVRPFVSARETHGDGYQPRFLASEECNNEVQALCKYQQCSICRSSERSKHMRCFVDTPCQLTVA